MEPNFVLRYIPPDKPNSRFVLVQTVAGPHNPEKVIRRLRVDTSVDYNNFQYCICLVNYVQRKPCRNMNPEKLTTFCITEVAIILKPARAFILMHSVNLTTCIPSAKSRDFVPCTKHGLLIACDWLLHQR
jgi:hypothetical protein